MVKSIFVITQKVNFRYKVVNQKSPIITVLIFDIPYHTKYSVLPVPFMSFLNIRPRSFVSLCLYKLGENVKGRLSRIWQSRQTLFTDGCFYPTSKRLFSSKNIFSIKLPQGHNLSTSKACLDAQFFLFCIHLKKEKNVGD